MTKDAQKDEPLHAGEKSAAADGGPPSSKDAVTEADAGASPPPDYPLDPRLERVRELAQRIKALRF